MRLKSFILALMVALTSVAALAVTPVEVLTDLKQRIAPDKRTAIWDVKATQQGS